MEKRFCVLREALSSNFRSVAWNLLPAVPLRAAGLVGATNAHGPKELLFPKTNRGCGLVTLALALAWVAQGADLELIGQWPGWPRGFANGVAVSGNYAYVANGSGGLQVLDVSNPANPQRVSYCGTSGSAQGVAVSGNYAYVADDMAGFQVIDVSTPANPQWVGGCTNDPGGRAWGVAVSGNYAYVADSGAGLHVIDVSSPANPQRVSRCAILGRPWAWR